MILDIIQIILAFLLVVLILMQNQGAGLGATFGGEGNIYRTKRGPEKLVFNSTIVIAILFLVISFYNALA